MNDSSTLKPGLRGWLIVLGIMLFGVAGNFWAYAIFMQREFTPSVIQPFIEVGSSEYDPRWLWFLFIEGPAFKVIALLVYLVLLPLYFLKHRFFRPMFFLISTLIALLIIGRVVLSLLIPTVAPAHRSAILFQAAFWGSIFLFWILYMIRSVRVSITFRRRILLSPVFPFFTTT